jgi:hypothetical protein
MERPWGFRNSAPSHTARLDERIYGGKSILYLRILCTFQLFFMSLHVNTSKLSYVKLSL